MQPRGQVNKIEVPSGFGRSNSTSSKPYPHLTFIDIPNPEAVRDRKRVRTARHHAVTVALARKRSKAQENGSNFYHVTFSERKSISKTHSGGARSMLTAPSPSPPVGLSSVDPFETLPVNARRLTVLFNLKSSLRAGEPIFNFNVAVPYQSLHSIFESSLTDGALTAALSLTLAYAATGWRANNECIELSSIAMQEIRQKLVNPVTATSSTTLGAILLLLGVAYRLGEIQNAKAHLDGLRILLQVCSERGITMPSPLKRSIYWQDLLSSVFLGTNRIVDYAEFYPKQQRIIKHNSTISSLPAGFIRSAHIFDADFLNVVEDVANLYASRHKICSFGDPTAMERLDDIQAELEGRLHNLRQRTSNHMLLCCIIATYLCVYGFWDGIWNGALHPRELSTKLLYHLHRCQRYDFGDNDLFLWVVYVGKAFAIDAPVRQGLDEVWVEQDIDAEDSTLPSWRDARTILSNFIWSEVLYSEDYGWFWERIAE